MARVRMANLTDGHTDVLDWREFCKLKLEEIRRTYKPMESGCNSDADVITGLDGDARHSFGVQTTDKDSNNDNDSDSSSDSNSVADSIEWEL